MVCCLDTERLHTYSVGPLKHCSHLKVFSPIKFPVYLSLYILFLLFFNFRISYDFLLPVLFVIHILIGQGLSSTVGMYETNYPMSVRCTVS